MKSIDKCVFDARPFLNIKTPEVAYILGLLWADGYIFSNKVTKQYRVCIEGLETDLYLLLDIFYKTGKWNVNRRIRKNRKPQMTIATGNKYLYHFLIENDYEIKSKHSANKILSKIPENLKHYWFRGLIDGDGSLYLNKKRSMSQFNCSSCRDQEWNFFTNLLKKLGIKRYTIRPSVKLKNLKSTNKISYYSDIRITNRKEIIKLLDYIYKDFSIDNIGLKRKYNTFLEIKNYERLNCKI